MGLKRGDRGGESPESCGFLFCWHEQIAIDFDNGRVSRTIDCVIMRGCEDCRLDTNELGEKRWQIGREGNWQDLPFDGRAQALSGEQTKGYAEAGHKSKFTAKSFLHDYPALCICMHFSHSMPN